MEAAAIAAGIETDPTAAETEDVAADGDDDGVWSGERARTEAAAAAAAGTRKKEARAVGPAVSLGTDIAAGCSMMKEAR